MTLDQLNELLKEDRLEKTPGQGYLCLLHNEGMVPSFYADGDAVLITAGLANAMDKSKEVETIIRSAVVYLDKVRAEGGEVV